jgi:hypothetical protein
MCLVNSYKANNNSIQFNSIYLCAKLNSHRPITKLAQVVQRRRSKELASIIVIVIIIIVQDKLLPISLF